MSLNQQYAATLGDLIMRQADVQAESARERARIGNAKGQLWGNFLGGVAKLITEAPERDLQRQETAARIQQLGDISAARKAQAQQANDAAAGQEELASLLKDPQFGGDLQKVAGELNRRGRVGMATSLLKQASEQTTASNAMLTAKDGQRQRVADRLSLIDPNSQDDPYAALAALHQDGIDSSLLDEVTRAFDSMDTASAIKKFGATAPGNIAAKKAADAEENKIREINGAIGRGTDPANYSPINPKPEAPAPAKNLSQQLAEAKTPDEVKRITGLMRTEALAKHIVDPKVPAPEKPNDSEGLAQTVIDNPALFDQLTATDKGRIAPILQAKGFDGFGRPLPPAAVKQIADTKTAIDSLNDLKQVLKDNEAYIGPIAGLAAMNPYSDAKQAQAKIDLVRQRVGKALEGGVLRKEDEEKYKQILATLRDTPTTAVSKVDSLIHSLQQDVENFIGQQRLSGRRVSQAQADSVKGGQGQNATSAAPAAPAASTGPQVGSVVTYNGKRYRVKSITNGRADLEAVQ